MSNEVVCKKVFYDINVEMGLDPYCHECVSHKARTRTGYVRCKRDGFVWMHKWVFWKATGEMPEVVKQLCGNKECLNPAHMEGITIEQAIAESPPSGPRKRPPVKWGNGHRRAIKDPAVVAQVRKYAEEGMETADICRKTGLERAQVTQVVRGQTYRD